MRGTFVRRVWPMIQVQLNLDGVAAPALRLIQLTSGVVVRGLRAIDEADFSEPLSLGGRGITLRLDDVAGDVESKRQSLHNWLLAKGFQDLARGLRLSLEEAYLWIRLLALAGQAVPPAGLNAKISEIRSEANRLNFPTLLGSVNEGLREELFWEPQFRSLQKARNCVEHRDGWVTQGIDTGDEAALRLSFPQLQLIVQQNGIETELLPGMIVDGESPLLIRKTVREMTFQAGTRFSLTSNEFGEIAQGCWMMVSDITGKLPRP